MATLIKSYQKSKGEWYHIIEVTIGGRTKRRKYRSDSEDPRSIKEQAKADIQQYFKEQDAEERASRQEDPATHEGDDKRDLLRAYARKAFSLEDPIEAYQAMRSFMPELIRMNLNLRQYAALLDTTEENVQRLNQRWQYLNSNRDTLQAYQQVKRGDEF